MWANQTKFPGRFDKSVRPWVSKGQFVDSRGNPYSVYKKGVGHNSISFIQTEDIYYIALTYKKICFKNELWVEILR